MVIALRLLRLAPLSLLGALGRLRLLGRLEGFSEFLIAEKPRGIRPRLLVFKRFGRKPPPPLLGRGLRVYLPPPDVDPVDPSAVARGEAPLGPGRTGRSRLLKAWRNCSTGAS